MTEQNKVRKFKLIDREGFLNGSSENEGILQDHLLDGIISGITDERGNIGDNREWCAAKTYIFEFELKFFEEVFEEEEEEEEE